MPSNRQAVGHTSASDDDHSAVFMFRAQRGKEAALAQWARRMVSAARRHEGNIATTALGPDHTGQYRVVHHFRDRAALESWLSSTQRAALLREGEPLLEAPPAVERTGLETWFQVPSDGRPFVPPPRWKMWLTSVVAIYPFVLAFLVWVNPHIKGWSVFVRAAVLPLVLLSLMTFLVMPSVTRLLAPWLASKRQQ